MRRNGVHHNQQHTGIYLSTLMNMASNFRQTSDPYQLKQSPYVAYIQAVTIIMTHVMDAILPARISSLPGKSAQG